MKKSIIVFNQNDNVPNFTILYSETLMKNLRMIESIYVKIKIENQIFSMQISVLKFILSALIKDKYFINNYLNNTHKLVYPINKFNSYYLEKLYNIILFDQKLYFKSYFKFILEINNKFINNHNLINLKNNKHKKIEKLKKKIIVQVYLPEYQIFFIEIILKSFINLIMEKKDINFLLQDKIFKKSDSNIIKNVDKIFFFLKENSTYYINFFK